MRLKLSSAPLRIEIRNFGLQTIAIEGMKFYELNFFKTFGTTDAEKINKKWIQIDGSFSLALSFI